jgi:hypothetical protein
MRKFGDVCATSKYMETKAPGKKMHAKSAFLLGVCEV